MNRGGATMNSITGHTRSNSMGLAALGSNDKFSEAASSRGASRDDDSPRGANFELVPPPNGVLRTSEFQVRYAQKPATPA